MQFILPCTLALRGSVLFLFSAPEDPDKVLLNLLKVFCCDTSLIFLFTERRSLTRLFTTFLFDWAGHIECEHYGGTKILLQIFFELYHCQAEKDVEVPMTFWMLLLNFANCLFLGIGRCFTRLRALGSTLFKLLRVLLNFQNENYSPLVLVWNMNALSAKSWNWARFMHFLDNCCSIQISKLYYDPAIIYYSLQLHVLIPLQTCKQSVYLLLDV